MSSTAPTHAIECHDITKRFGTVLANDSVNLNVRYGEILALLGENGSGKTTLVNMLSGIYHPDSGSIFVAGSPATINSPSDAFRYGIGMIHQHFKLVDVMSAFENILLGTPQNKTPLAKLREKVAALANEYGLQVDLDQKIYDMSVSEKQTVEVLKVLFRGAKTLILDEPTAVLTPQEIQKLFDILRKMKAEGCAVIIITHKLGEVMEISDRVTVLRKGQSITTVNTAETNEKELTETMVGHAVSLQIARPEFDESKKQTVLEVKDLTVNRPDGARGLQNAAFSLHSGEILGIAGVAGSGQKELCEAIVGLADVQGGEVLYDGENMVGKDTTEIYRRGISLAFVPEDRLGMGLVSTMGMVDNLMLKTYKNSPGPFLDRAPSKEVATRLKKQLEIKTPSIETPVRMLSGGNVQKVLLGREIESSPRVLLTAYPVRGLDIHSSYTIYDLLNEQKMKGCAVMFVGEDLDVLLELADRIMVLCAGEVTGIVDAKTATKEQVGLMMTGIKQESDKGGEA